MVPCSPASPNCRLSSDTYVASGDKDALSVIQVRYPSINPTSVQELVGRVADPFSFDTDPDPDPAF